MKDLISIIVPIFKVEQYLNQCVDSIINQTYTNIEIILVDDGSPDKSGDIADEYMVKDKRIKVFHKENGGLSDARNFGIEQATGKYIGFVDSDDYIENDMYEVLHKLINNNNADISICSFYNVVEGEVSIKNSDLNDLVINSKEALIMLLEDKITNHAPNKLYKRELFREIRYPLGKTYEDIGTTYKLFEKAKIIAFINSPKYYYRINRIGSITASNNSSNLKNYLLVLKSRHKNLSKNKEITFYNDTSYIKNILYLHYLAIRYNAKEFFKCDLLKKEYMYIKKLISKKTKNENNSKALWKLYTKTLILNRNLAWTIMRFLLKWRKK